MSGIREAFSHPAWQAVLDGESKSCRWQHCCIHAQGADVRSGSLAHVGRLTTTGFSDHNMQQFIEKPGPHCRLRSEAKIASRQQDAVFSGFKAP